MILITKDGKEVEATFYGPQDDIQCSSAVYTETGEDVEDDVLEELIDTYIVEISEECYQNAIMAAEYAFEGDR